MKLLSNKWFLLSLGGVLLGFTGMNWNIPIFAWFALIPFMRYVRIGHSIWILLACLILIQIFSTMRIVSEPLHLIIALISGIQGGIVFTCILWFWNQIRKKYKSLSISIFTFAFSFTIMEWIGANYSELGVWGMLANSQLHNIILLQSASIFGATGISFLIYWFNAMAEELVNELDTEKRIHKQTMAMSIFFLSILIILLFYGTIRLTIPIQGTQVKVATITSHKSIQAIWNDPKENELNTEIVMQRTLQAAREGAKIIVWNEGAILVSKTMQTSFLESISKIAKENQIEIIAALIVPEKDDIFFVENKIQWIGKNGETRQIYHKQFIPPGEPIYYQPSDVRVIPTEWGLMSIAICYDFDSLSLTKKHMELGSGLTLIPASDWKGIDPFHTEMAALRGIENGSSIVRSTRGALSGIYDPYGRAKGTLMYDENSDGVLVATVPSEQIPTVYKSFGNWVVSFGFIYFIMLGGKYIFSLLKKFISNL
ncbi:MAG: acyltransferase [Leptospira sp.]|nr:acyltransferase [Leptospira sp.]